jgi:hypothetical protein
MTGLPMISRHFAEFGTTKTRLEDIMVQLGSLVRVGLREVWTHEATEFTPWLARPENLAALGDAIGLELELVSQEEFVGPYRADIICKDRSSGQTVLVENQLERTDHQHLGQILTYAAGVEAKTIVWVASRFTDEHRAALDWLNEITDEEYQFFGLEIELWRIGMSAPAPKFNLISSPNEWSRSIKEATAVAKAHSPKQELYLRYWQLFHQYQREQSPPVKAPKPAPQQWLSFSTGRTGFTFEAIVSFEKGLSVRLYVVSSNPNPKAVFNYFHTRKNEIEAAVGTTLEWSEMPGKKGIGIGWYRAGCDFEDESRWPEYVQWHAQALKQFDDVFRPMIKNLPVEQI